MYSYKCQVVRVVDGDTVVVNVSLGLDVYTDAIIRLYGVDTPERGKVGYLEATAFTRAWLAANADDDGWLRLETIKDKKGGFGRYLGIIDSKSVTGDSLNAALLAHGHAEVYSR